MPLAHSALGRLRSGVPAGLNTIERLKMVFAGTHQIAYENYEFRSVLSFMALLSLTEFVVSGFTRELPSLEWNLSELYTDNGLPLISPTSNIHSPTFEDSDIENSL